MYFFSPLNLNRGVFAGIKHVAGDMFESIPNSDAIMVKVSLLVKFYYFYKSL